MSIRSLYVGPSRGIKSALRAPSVVVSRNLVIPHPAVDKPGQTQFQVDLSTSRPHEIDVFQAFTVLRAVEQALGTSVISIDVYREADGLRALPYLHFTTLHPVEYTDPILIRIKNPEFPVYDIYGGPSLSQVQNVMNRKIELAKEGEPGWAIKIRADTTPVVKAKSAPLPRNWSRDGKRQFDSSEKILDTLEDLGGDWAKIAARYQHLRPRDKKPHRIEGESTSGEAGEEALSSSQGGEVTGGRRDASKSATDAKDDLSLGLSQSSTKDIRQKPERQAEHAPTAPWRFQIGKEPSQTESLPQSTETRNFTLPVRRAPTKSQEEIAEASNSKGKSARRLTPQEALSSALEKIRQKQGKSPFRSSKLEADAEMMEEYYEEDVVETPKEVEQLLIEAPLEADQQVENVESTQPTSSKKNERPTSPKVDKVAEKAQQHKEKVKAELLQKVKSDKVEKQAAEQKKEKPAMKQPVQPLAEQTRATEEVDVDEQKAEFVEKKTSAKESVKESEKSTGEASKKPSLWQRLLG